MFCPDCGQEIPENGKFCMFCGSNLSVVIEDINGVTVEEEIKEDFAVEESVYKEDNDDNQKSNTRYLAVEMTDIPIPLLSGERLEKFKRNYLVNDEFIFSFGNYEIRYNENIVMDINTIRYFFRIGELILGEFETEYKRNVVNAESFFNQGMILYDKCLSKIAGYTAKILVASGIMGYSQNNIRQEILLHTDLQDFLTRLSDKYEQIIYEGTYNDASIDMKHIQRSGSLFVGGGFGFAGALGGMAAAGMANMTSGAINSMMTGISKSRNRSQVQKRVNALFCDSSVLIALKRDFRSTVSDMSRLYMRIYEQEYQTQYPDYYNGNVWTLLQNTTEYVQDKNLVLKNMSQLLSMASPMMTEGHELKFCIEKFIDNREIIEEVLVLADFFLLKEEMEEFLEKEKSKHMAVTYQLKEDTTENIRTKIEAISQKSLSINYDGCATQIERLKKKLEIMEEDERIAKEKEDKLKQILTINLKDAERLHMAFENGDLQTVMKMAAAGSMIAEELYIQYYIQRIREEENKQLFDAIAGQCGNNRAYDCIVAVCCYNGYGTLVDMDVVKELLLSSAKEGCTYAQAYISYLIMQKKMDFIGKEVAKRYSDIALEKLSPYACLWEGKKYCQGDSAEGSNKIPNDYDKAIGYIEYAHQCGIEGADKVLEYLHSSTKEKINSTTYSSGNSSGCFITTAVCDSFGKPDDCWELMLLRSFRDTYLAKTADGVQLIKEYYRIAPEIVNQINMRPQREYIYLDIWNGYLSPCIDAIEGNEYEKCRRIYITMVEKLKEDFLNTRT